MWESFVYAIEVYIYRSIAKSRLSIDDLCSEKSEEKSKMGKQTHEKGWLRDWYNEERKIRVVVSRGELKMNGLAIYGHSIFDAVAL